ncbi:MAG: CvpA family protein [Candidatus Nanopelagicaceae bacterium]
MILDLILAGLIIFAIAQGFNRGLLPTLFALIGYLGGGVIGLLAAKELSSDWSGVVSIVGFYLFAIFAGSQLGSWLMAKVGSGLRKRLLLGPLKFLDSVLGGGLALIQTAIFAALVLTIINYLPWELPNNLIEDSRIYESVAGFNLLSFQIEDLLESVSSHLDQLKS